MINKITSFSKLNLKKIPFLLAYIINHKKSVPTNYISQVGAFKIIKDNYLLVFEINEDIYFTKLDELAFIEIKPRHIYFNLKNKCFVLSGNPDNYRIAFSLVKKLKLIKVGAKDFFNPELLLHLSNMNHQNSTLEKLEIAS